MDLTMDGMLVVGEHTGLVLDGAQTVSVTANATLKFELPNAPQSAVGSRFAAMSRSEAQSRSAPTSHAHPLLTGLFGTSLRSVLHKHAASVPSEAQRVQLFDNHNAAPVVMNVKAESSSSERIRGAVLVVDQPH